MTALSYVAITASSFALMEPFTWAFHRYVMHGFGWGWHRSHHEPHQERFEKNDLFALVFSGIGVALFVAGLAPGYTACTFIGLGVTLYGAVYLVVHDGLCHARVPLGRWLEQQKRSGYLKRLVQAHRLHHASAGREGAVSFGFLYARDPRELKREIGLAREQLRENPSQSSL